MAKLRSQKPTGFLSIIFIIAGVAILYYLDLPIYAKFEEKNTEIAKLIEQLKVKTDYDSEINNVAIRLEEIDWDSKSLKIDANFTSSPFFLPEKEIFFKELISKSNMSFGSINFSQPTSVKSKSSSGAASNQAESSIAKATMKPQEQAQQQQQQTAEAGFQGNLLSGLKADVKKTSFTLSVNGSYLGLKGLLEIFENQAYIINVKSVKFSAGDDANAIDFSIDGEIYSY